MKDKRFPPMRLSWIVWGLGALFYMTGFYHRVAPAVMTDSLMRDFHIGAAVLGQFSAFYFYSYVAMQIPTGIIADRWGPRKLLTAGAMGAAIGTLLFASAPTLAWANAGRLVIGGSVAVAWVVLLKLAAAWFPPRRFAFVTGVALFFGIAGAVSAGMPLRMLVDAFGWRGVMGASTGVSLLLAVAIWLVVRDDPEFRGYKSYSPTVGETDPGHGLSVLAGLGRVLIHRNTWLLSIAPAGMVGPVLAFSGLWGVPFFTTHYGLSAATSAAINSILMAGWAIGGPILGGLSDRIGRRKPIYISGAAVCLAGWFILLFSEKLPVPLLIVLVTVIGFASGGMIVGFAFVKESVPPSLAGTVSGVCNMGVMMGPMILQPAMGRVLDSRWGGVVEQGARIYGLDAYRAAFTLILAFSLLSLVLVSLTRETYCRVLPS